MLLARYLRHKKHPLLFARRTYVKQSAEGPLTLRPESLIALRRTPLDFSNRTTRSVLSVPLYYVSTRRFPAGSKGFLYYQPGSTELSGQLRLRICDSAFSFGAGRDLLINDVQPWGFDLVNLVRNPRHTPLVATIVKDGFVSQQTIADLRVHLADTGARPWRNILCALSEPFYTQLDHLKITLNTVSKQHIGQHSLSYIFSSIPQGKHYRDPSQAISPFTGILKVRFELSKLPEHASLGPTLVLKVLEVHNLRHVRNDIVAVKEPAAGEYHYRMSRGKLTIWRYCIDEVDSAREAFGPLLHLPGIVYAG